ncbi:hypothetical protein KKF84_15990 [Myxococcota bacterium]|nr:hypothetical protein [Myxococcota bacterium]MBU1536827.1 hypothetical protein [Myxococcota bacterium]
MLSRFFAIGFILSLSLFVVACDDDSSSNNTNNVNNVNNVNNTNNLNNTTAEVCDDDIDNDNDGDVDCDDLDCADDPACVVETREAFELTISLHDAGTQMMNLRTKEAGGDLPSCDFGFLDDEAAGPRILLCPNTVAYNAGNAEDFLDVTVAPDDVTYESDAGTDYVIDNTWLDGGSCATGWTCNGNIYILLLQDGSYAKIEVTYGMGGTVTVMAFRDIDGADDLTCEPIPE